MDHYNTEQKQKSLSKLLFRIGIPAAILLVTIIVLPLFIGINDAGQRTVVQWPNGKLFVKFTPGVYIQAFGRITEYNDFVTFDFDRTPAEGGKATIDQKGISVRYQDGGMGTIFGIARFKLPVDTEEMIGLHKAFRSNSGFANKLIKPVTEEAMNLTAGLMGSEEAYATKRAIFTQLVKSQIGKGKFQTVLETTSVTDEVTGKTLWKELPVIALDKNNQQIHLPSDLAKFGVTVAGFQLNDPGFEESTMKQISDKRGATMAIITAIANAEKAKQMAITAEENGKANVMTAKYEQEVEKEKAIVVAERIKQVAVIKAKQQVDVAKQVKLEALVVAERKVDVAAQAKREAEQIKLRAKEIKEANILEGEGLAQKKRLIMQADGALEQKLDAYKHVMTVAFAEIGKQKWVPEITFGGGALGSENNAAMTLIQLLTTNAAKDLALDLAVEQPTPID
jgi:hypothetical protein